MKKLISIILVLAMIFVMSAAAFASTTDAANDSSIQVITVGELTAYSKKNADGSYTIFETDEYGAVIESHTTVPGSGVVKHTIYHSDGSIITDIEITKQFSAHEPLRINPTSTSNREMGYMHYNSGSGTTYSIDCWVYDEYYANQTYTFYTGTAKSLSAWISTLMSVWLFLVHPTSIIGLIMQFLDDYGILGETTNNAIAVIITRTVKCNYNNQEFSGYATSPSSNYPTGSLEGVYGSVVTTNASGTTISTSYFEGYTTHDWGTAYFGRKMMYKVFGTEYVPTSWTNL